MKIIYWNARSILQRKHELQVILQDADIFVVVESWLTPNIKNFQFPGFVSFRKDRDHSVGGGILVLIRRNIAYKEITNIKSPNKSVELCGLRITNTNPAFNLFICYRAPGLVLNINEWKSIFQNLNSIDNNIIVGDFNAHHVSWNCTRTDKNGENLLECLEVLDLFIHNLNSVTHIDSTSQSNIDLVISNHNVVDKIESIVHDDTWGSDHYPIFIIFNVEKCLYKKKSFKIRSTRTDWNQVIDKLKNSYEDFLSVEYDSMPADQKYSKFVKIVTDAVKNSTPNKKKVSDQKYRNPVSWWDEECQAIKQKRKAAFLNWDKTKEFSDLIEYKRISALAKKFFKTKKKASYITYAETLTPNISSTYVWDNARILKNKWIKITPSHHPENLQTQNKFKTLDKICPPWVPTDPDYFPSFEKNEFLEASFTFAEFNSALDTRNATSSPGLDGFDYYVLKMLPIKYKLILLDIYNAMFKTGKFPNSWRETYVHFVSKPDGINYRPIALTSVLCKLFETIIKNKFQWWIETNNVLPKNQSGFRKGFSCADNLLNLTINIKKRLKMKKEYFAVFLDVCSAFDNVNSDLLIKKLADLGCSRNIIQFVKFLTYERIIHTSVTEQTRRCNKGVPQGGVLSPLLYIIYVSEISKYLPSTVTISQFADDIGMFSYNKNSLQKAIQSVNNELSKLGLELAPHKSIFVNFNNKSIRPGETEIKISDTCTIKSSEMARFLGILFDYKLSFIPHINLLLNKSHRALNIVKYLQGTWWGADPRTLITFYKSYIRPIIEYGCFIFFPTNKQLIKRIEQIQYKAIRAALGYRITTPLNILLAESKLPSIYSRTTFLCKTYLIKILSNKNHLTYSNVHDYYSKILNKAKNKRKQIFETCIIDLIRHPYYFLKTDTYVIYEFDYNVLTTTIPYNIELGKELTQSRDPNNKINSLIVTECICEIYTDGSKDRGTSSAGSAVFCPTFNKKVQRKLDRNTSVFTAECIAMCDALDLALEKSNSNICIFTDSLSLLSSLQKISLDIRINPYILEIKKKYVEFLEKTNGDTNIKFFWIPSHHGIKGNEIADSLAKEAGKNDPDNTILEIPFSDLKELFKKTMTEESNEIILKNSKTNGQTYFKDYYKNVNKPWFYKQNITRELIVSVNRLRANHYNLAASLARVNIINDAKCKCNDYEEEIDHVVWQCSVYNQERGELLQNLLLLNIQLPMKMSVIIAEPNVPACQYVINFLKKCKLTV